MLIFSLINICHSWAVLPSVEFSHSVISNSLWPRELQHARLPCPSPIPGACSNSCPSLMPSNHLIHIVPFSSCLQASPASWSFQMSQFFTSFGQMSQFFISFGQRSQFFTSFGQSIGVSASASVLPVNIQDWFPLGWIGCISLQSKGLSRVFSNTTVQKHQFFSAQPSSQSNSHIHTWPQGKP